MSISAARLLAIASSLAALSLVTPAAARPIRATRYDGTWQGKVTFPHAPAFDATVAMTIEAWVRRDAPLSCETIVSHGQSTSYWLGLCQGGKLRFYRGNGVYAQSALSPVGLGRWAHVAASYDGSTVHFYVDGVPAGDAPLAHAGANAVSPLWIGSQNGVAGFNGLIDEVRIWSVARTQLEIQQGRYEELRNVPGLVAAFPAGGTLEAIGNTLGQADAGASATHLGILPSDLVVPRAVYTPALDGTIDSNGEYLGSEVVALPYLGAFDADAEALLVHTDDDLYVGVRGLRAPLNGANPATFLGVMLDPTHGQHGVPAPTDRLVQAWPIQNQLSFSHGNGDGTYGSWSADGIQVVSAACDGDTPGLLKCYEVKIPAALLAQGEPDPWDDEDGFAIGHFEPTLAHDYVAPGETMLWGPWTWATMTYSDEVAAGANATVFGKVWDELAPLPSSPKPLPGWPVVLRTTTAIVATTTTSATGDFVFNAVPVPPNAKLIVEMGDCSGACIKSQPTFGPGTQPALVADQRHVEYPPCAASQVCGYAPIGFYALQPPGAVQPVSAVPAAFTPQFVLRDDPAKLPNPLLSPAPVDDPTTADDESVMRFDGASFHHLVEVYLSPPHLNLNPAVWPKYPAAVLDVAADGSWIEVAPPLVPIPALQSGWKWVFHDTWPRPGRVEWTTLPADLKEPPFPWIHGFSFKNHATTPNLEDFDGTYGNNGFICVGAFGWCACRVRDPIYLFLWLPIHMLAVESTDGNCAGMAATSLLLAHENLQAEDLESYHHFAAGFTESGAPGSFDHDWCSAADPEDLWAHVRSNHGVQMSSENIHHYLQQSSWCLGPGICGDPLARAADIASNPTEWVVCMTRADEGDGHCVAPYKVDEDATKLRIWIYDNNYPRPNDTSYVLADHYIDVFKSTNRYWFPHKTHTSPPEIWEGVGLFAVPLDVYRGGHHMPGIETIGDVLDDIVSLIAGAADPEYTAPNGQSWGWDAAGALHGKIDGAMAYMPAGLGEGAQHDVPFLMEISKGAPSIKVRARGGAYVVHVANAGRVVQMEVADGVAGDVDLANVAYEGSLLSSLKLTAARDGTRVTPKLGLVLAERERAVLRWHGLSADAGASVRVKALPDKRGGELHNASGAARTYVVDVDHVDGASDKSGRHVFGPISAPAGASQRALIHDWPDAKTLRVETDANLDGVFETTQLFAECIGQVDETAPDGAIACGTDLPGACGIGQLVSCDGGASVSCKQTVFPASERCANGVDDDCDGVVDDGCGPAHDTCSAGAPLEPDDGQCVADLCSVDPYCCNVWWDGICIAEVRTVCESLRCAEAQGTCAHPQCASGTQLVSGCDAGTAACVSQICGVDPYCCSVAWDGLCVWEVQSVCGKTCD